MYATTGKNVFLHQIVPWDMAKTKKPLRTTAQLDRWLNGQTDGHKIIEKGLANIVSWADC